MKKLAEAGPPGKRPAEARTGKCIKTLYTTRSCPLFYGQLLVLRVKIQAGSYFCDVPGADNIIAEMLARLSPGRILI
jgi:hypothetical protein